MMSSAFVRDAAQRGLSKSAVLTHGCSVIVLLLFKHLLEHNASNEMNLNSGQ